MVVWGIVAQLLIGAATITVAFRVGTRNADVADRVGGRHAEEAAKATLQREIAGRREEWWRRMSWALKATTSENAREAHIGFRMVAELLRSDLATPDDLALGDIVSDAVLIALDPPPDLADTEENTTTVTEEEELR